MQKSYPTTIHLKDLDQHKPEPDAPAQTEPDLREQFIKSNPKSIPHELQLMLVDIQTEFAQYLVSPQCKLSNDEANNLWFVVRKIFRSYGLE
jgi:hypothetical protein